MYRTSISISLIGMNERRGKGEEEEVGSARMVEQAHAATVAVQVTAEEDGDMVMMTSSSPSDGRKDFTVNEGGQSSAEAVSQPGVEGVKAA